MKLFGLGLLTVVAFSLLYWQQEQSGLPDDFQLNDFQLKNCYATLNSCGVESSVQSANQFLVKLLPNQQTDQQVAEYVQRLSSAKYKDREAAERDLISLGSQSLGLLARAAEGGDPETKSRARRCLAVIEHSLPKLISAAINVLWLDPDPSLSRTQRLETLFEVAGNLKGLGIEDDVRRAVIGIVDKECAASVIGGLDSPDGFIKEICIRALPKCCSEARLGSFSYLFVDPNSQHSLAAIESFGEIDPDVAIRQLVDVLIRSEIPQVRMHAAGLLRSLSNKYFGLDPLADTFNQKKALGEWQRWREDNAPFSKKIFAAIKTNSELQPIGFVVSSNGQALTYFEANGGEKVWELPVPLYDAQACKGQRFLICERSANQVRFIDRDGKTLRIVKNVNSPADAEYLANRNVLVAQGIGVITEHDVAGNVIRKFEGLSTPFDVDRLRNGNTLVADSGNDRIVEFDESGKIVWQKAGLAFPNNVFRMRDGRTLYSTYTSGKVGMLSAGGELIWEKAVGENSTLYSLHYAGGRIFVSDGRNRRICVLDGSGQLVKEIPLQINSFCDVGFVTSINR